MITFKNISILLGVILLTHITGMLRSWYFAVPWLDIPMHFMGGFWVALLTIWLMKVAPGIFGKPSVLGDLIIILGFTALIGILWEFMEFSIDILIIAKNGLPEIWRTQLGLTDTMGDLFFDLLGGLVAFFIGLREKSLKRFSKVFG